MVGQAPGNYQQQGVGRPPRLLEVLRGSRGGLKELYKRAESLETLIDCIDEFTRAKTREIKTNQIRKFYDKVRSLEQKLEKVKLSSQQESEINEQARIGVLSLKPLLAYAVGRQRSLKDLADILDAAISRVYDYEDFKKFVELFQAIVAYHKYHGGD